MLVRDDLSPLDRGPTHYGRRLHRRSRFREASRGTVRRGGRGRFLAKQVKVNSFVYTELVETYISGPYVTTPTTSEVGVPRVVNTTHLPTPPQMLLTRLLCSILFYSCPLHVPLSASPFSLSLLLPSTRRRPLSTYPLSGPFQSTSSSENSPRRVVLGATVPLVTFVS